MMHGNDENPETLNDINLEITPELGQEPDFSTTRRLRRVVIEEDQRRKIDHARLRNGYADDISPHSHDKETFKLINQRKELDELPEADYVVPTLDRWKFWVKMNDWDSRNRLLENLITRMRRREAAPGEMQFLVVVCAPAWNAVARSLRKYGGADLDPQADGHHRREEARRANELDRQELDHVVQNALFDALCACPRPFPRRFFPWLRETLAYHALEHIRSDIYEHNALLPHDSGITEVLDSVLPDHTAPGAPLHSQWLRTKDLASMFEIAKEYAPYARVRGACEAAVNRLPSRQRQVIQQHYYEEMKQVEIAAAHGIADSTVRNTHQGALRNLRRDDQLFDVLEAVGRVRDSARRLKLQQADAEARLRAA